MPLFLPHPDAPPRVTHANLPGFSADAVQSAFRPFMPQRELDAAVGAYGAVHHRALTALDDARPEVDPEREGLWSERLANHPLRSSLVPLLASPGVVTDYLHAFAPPWSPDVGKMAFPGFHPNSPVIADTNSRHTLLATALANPFQSLAGVSVFDDQGGHLGSLLTGTHQTPDDVVSAAGHLHARLGDRASLLVPFYHTPYLGTGDLTKASNTLWRTISDKLRTQQSPLTVHDILRTAPTRFFSQAKGLTGRVDADFGKLDPVSRAVAASLTGPNSSRSAGLRDSVWAGAFPVASDHPTALYDDLSNGADLLDAQDLLVTPPASDVATRERLGDALSQRGLNLMPFSDI